MKKEDIQDVAAHAYYVNPQMIRFLVIENLALKSILHEKGLISPEEFLEHKNRATELLDERANQQMLDQMKEMLTAS